MAKHDFLQRSLPQGLGHADFEGEFRVDHIHEAPIVVEFLLGDFKFGFFFGLRPLDLVSSIDRIFRSVRCLVRRDFAQWR